MKKSTPFICYSRKVNLRNGKDISGCWVGPGREIYCEGQAERYFEDGTVRFLSCGGAFVTTCICHNSQNSKPKRVNTTLCKLKNKI